MIDNRWIRQRGGISQVAVIILRNLAQNDYSNLGDAERQERRGENKKSRPGLEKVPVAGDEEELVDQTEEASYEDQF